MKTYLALLALPFFVSCNFHTESVCSNKPKISLEKFVGDFEIMTSDEEGVHDYTAKFSHGTKAGTYSLVASEGDQEAEAVFIDATVCQIGERVFAESYSVFDPDSLTLAEITENSDTGKLEVGMLLYNQDKLEKADIEFEDMSMEGFEGFASKVNNKNLAAEELIKFFEVVSVLYQK